VIAEPLVAPATQSRAVHRGWPEGIRAGLLAAAAGALWSLLVDVAAGNPFRSWYFIGYGFLSLIGPPGAWSPAVASIVFLVFVALVFMLVGRLAIAVAHRADSQPSLLLFANTIFTLVTLALFVSANAFRQSGFGAEAWLEILGSPLIALWMLAYRVYRTHPSLKSDFKRAEDA
jgi:hypothetical protein